MIVGMEFTKHAYTFLLLLLIFISKTSGTIEENMTALMPVGPTEYRFVGAEMDSIEPRRKLSPFQVCLMCRCCVMVSDPTTCSNMPCCFGIDCQLPNKPFGVCAFVPKTCNCTTCAASP